MEKTKGEIFKSAIKMALCILPVALAGGFFVGIYTFEHMEESMQIVVLEQMGSYEAFLAVTTVQSVIYGMVATILGYFIANSLGLIKSFKFEKEILIKVVPVIIILGIVFACDYFVFGRIIPEVAADYEKGISVAYLLGSLTYGGVIEELLLRWFFMSAIAWIVWKLFAGKTTKKNIPTWVFVVANIVAALIFAAGHLPATVAFFGGITPLILFRCFLLNGGFALLFGRYYRKYGIQYAMLGHFGLHLVSKLILMCVL